MLLTSHIIVPLPLTSCVEIEIDHLSTKKNYIFSILYFYNIPN